jgi:hypothetical protein
MGRTKTVCYCKSRKCKTSSPRVGQAPYEETRRELIGNLRRYLEEEPCVPGSSNETLALDPLAQHLGAAYRVALGRMAAAVQAGDADDVLRHGATVGDAIREIVQLPTLLPTRFEADRIPTRLAGTEDEHRHGVERFLTEYLRDDDGDTASEADLFADLLGRAYAKALAELRFALEQNETPYVTHHTAVIADLVDEMIELWVLRTDYFSEEILPEDHPHRRMTADRLAEVRGEGTTD